MMDNQTTDMKVWSNDYEKILKEWKARSFVYMWLQLKSGYYYMYINDLLTYPVIVLSSISSATLFASDDYIARIIIAVFSIISVILTGVLLELCPGQKTEEHSACMKRHATLIRNIDYCLSLPPQMRTDPIGFIDKVSTEMDFISENDNVIPKRVIHKFENRFGNLDKLLYGEEIMDLIAEDIKTMKIATKLLRHHNDNTSSISTMDVIKKQF